MMFCSKCGAQNDDGAKFCTGCGAPLQGSAPTGGTPSNTAGSDAQAYNGAAAPDYNAQNYGNTPNYNAQNYGNTPNYNAQNYGNTPNYNAQGYAPQNQAAGYANPQGYNVPGAGNTGYAPYGNPPFPPKKKKSSAPVIVGIVIGLILIASIVIAVILGAGGRSCEKVLDQFMEMYETMDITDLPDLIPDQAVEAILDDYELTRADMAEQLEEATKEAQSEFEALGLKMTLSHKILGKEEITGEDLKELNENLQEEYGLTCDQAMLVEVEISIKSESEFLNSADTEEFWMLKVGQNWYMDPDYLDDVVY